MGTAEGRISEGLVRIPGLLAISMGNCRFSSDALIAALSRHKKNRLANLGTELNNLWHNLNM